MEPQEQLEETPVAETVTEEMVAETPVEPVAETPAPEAPSEMSRVRDQLVAAGAPDNLDVIAAAKWLVDENARLRPLADMGRQYRSDLIEEALTEGVRAMGETFPMEQYRAMLGTSSLDTIKAIRGSFETQAKLLFEGGRRVKETQEKTPTTPVAQERVNIDAHRAR